MVSAPVAWLAFSTSFSAIFGQSVGVYEVSRTFICSLRVLIKNMP